MKPKANLSILLVASIACSRTWAQQDDAPLLPEALKLDDQCSGSGDVEQCALTMLQLSGKPQCDCAWAVGGANCGDSDGSMCWDACCSGGAGRPKDTCSNEVWQVAYSPHHCRMDGDVRVISCMGKVGDECGTRLSSSVFIGVGTASMGIKAASGPGVATTFYLSSNGGLYDKMKQRPWVELDFEIMGHMAGQQSQIWTNMFTGIAIEHNEWIKVPVDVTAGYHTYAFEMNKTSVSWTVDGVVYRTEHIVGFPDVQAAIGGSKLQEFVSVWGKSSSDPGEGVPEFRAGLGVLDQNPNKFPIYAGYKFPLQ